MSSVHGPFGVQVSWDEPTAFLLGISTLPFVMRAPVLWSNFHGSDWHTLPLSNRLGVPLRFMKRDSVLGRVHTSPNDTLKTLSLDLNPESDTFAEAKAVVHCNVLFSRADGKDLTSRQLQTVVGFVEEVLGDVLAYGKSKKTSTFSIEGDLASDEKASESEDESSEDEDDDVEQNPAPKIITRAEAEAGTAKATPENFTAFFERFCAERVAADQKWAEVECPVQISVCHKCGKDEQQEKPLLVCGDCRLAQYCDRECQKESWGKHKMLCKAIGPKLGKDQK
ncbi:hypothetical protein CERZMDRAFT_107083 [Cercospora zeae-maydis SCOH1-5]|uniref:MYND-type domain-containing protein n=1 Tax=Cercospora zeae-maydis SCOH1-5 TaxID=717836 RepID=A0A6A6F808_9PEZI|nr:hypothetical protein CERZMDRAFT_107083 [Cercospora zeae-maydis SCOH1-5]